jgi:hypothetical protein
MTYGLPSINLPSVALDGLHYQLVAWVAFPKWRWTKVAQKSQNLRLLLLQ